MPPADRLQSEAVQKVLAREHERAKQDEPHLSALRDKIAAAKVAGTFSYDLYPDDVYLAIEPAMGRFLYLAARSINARHIVEFGTSFGISTIYLAAAAQENGGRVIGTELVPKKAERAQANLEEAGLADCVEIRLGDAIETLQDIDGPVDLLFLDGWKDLYLPVLEFMQPALRPGALVLADNIATFPEELAPYVARVSDPAGPFRSVVVPFESGLAYSLYEGRQAAAS
jgi:predicted O-methyltransferase YrrM